MFKSFNNSGFHLQFKNGIIISIQFGPHSYCVHNRINSNAKNFDFNAPTKCEEWKSKDAEIAIINTITNKWYDFDEEKWGPRGCSTKGYCLTDEVVHWISFAKNYNTKLDKLLWSEESKEY